MWRTRRRKWNNWGFYFGRGSRIRSRFNRHEDTGGYLFEKKNLLTVMLAVSFFYLPVFQPQHHLNGVFL
jgi:hypothetical protein